MHFKLSKQMKVTSNKYLISFLLISFLNYLGCCSSQAISKIDLDEGKAQLDFNYEVIVETTDSMQYHFEARQYQIANDTLYGEGTTESQGKISAFKGKISMNEINSFTQPELDAGTTAGIGLGIIIAGAVAVGLILLAAVTDVFNPD